MGKKVEIDSDLLKINLNNAFKAFNNVSKDVLKDLFNTAISSTFEEKVAKFEVKSIMGKGDAVTSDSSEFADVKARLDEVTKDGPSIENLGELVELLERLEKLKAK